MVLLCMRLGLVRWRGLRVWRRVLRLKVLRDVLRLKVLRLEVLLLRMLELLLLLLLGVLLLGELLLMGRMWVLHMLLRVLLLVRMRVREAGHEVGRGRLRGRARRRAGHGRLEAVLCESAHDGRMWLLGVLAQHGAGVPLLCTGEHLHGVVRLLLRLLLRLLRLLLLVGQHGLA